MIEDRVSSPEQEPAKKRILITGAKGTIGRVLVEAFQTEYDVLQLDRDAAEGAENEFGVDISDEKALEQAFGAMGAIDAIVHLAASADHETPIEEVYKNNRRGTLNMYEAARKHGVKRVIFASSTHLVAYEGYPKTSPLGRPITVFDPYRPDSEYGKSKGYGETLAKEYYDLYGIETIAIRIGAVSRDNNPVPPYEKLWLSHQDAAQVFRQALETEIPFGIYFATSDNQDLVYDIGLTKQDLGYAPTDGIKKT